MEITKYVNQINEQGYALIENVVSPEAIHKMQIRFEELIEKYEADFDTSRISEVDMGIIRCMVNRGDCFEKLFYVPEVVNIARVLLGDFIHYSFNGSYASKKFAHPASRFHTDVPVWTNNVTLSINNFYLIDDTTSENGATWVIPGSHLLELPPTDSYIDRHKIQVTGKAGSVIMLHSKLYHATGTNYTNNHRKCIANLMRRSFMKPQFNWQKVLTPDAIAYMNDETKRLFDFYTSPPNSADEYYKEGVRRRNEKKGTYSQE